MPTEDSAPKQPKKTSSVRHTRAIQRDRSKHPPAAPPDEQVTQRLTELIRPATFSTVAFYYDLGLRARLLTLPIMVALVLTMIWRQVGSVCQLVHLLNTEGLFWAEPTQVSQQAVSERLRTLPAPLFQQVLLTLLPQLQTRWQSR